MAANLLLGGAMFNFVGSLGANVVCSAVNTTVNGTLSVINLLMQTRPDISSDIEKYIDSSDLQLRLRVIQTIVADFKDIESSSAVHITLESLNETLLDLKNLIESIYKKKKEHMEKWFYKWRSCYLTVEYQQLKSLDLKIQGRFELLLEVNTLLKLKL